MKLALKVDLLLILLFVTPFALAQQRQTNRDLKQSFDRTYVKLARKYGFSIPRKLKFDKRMRGTPLPQEALELNLDRFFLALEELTVDFVKRSGLNTVMICQNLTYEGKRAGGMAKGNVIYLDAGFTPHVVYHELFHIFDRINDRKWNRLNPKNFVYTGSVFFDAELSRRDMKKLEANQGVQEIDLAFVSDYAKSFPREDRAETFAFMVCEGPAFLLRTNRSPHLKAKMDMIIKATATPGLLGKDYWDKKLFAAGQ